jgi:hypothetical protein
LCVYQSNMVTFPEAAQWPAWCWLQRAKLAVGHPTSMEFAIGHCSFMVFLRKPHPYLAAAFLEAGCAFLLVLPMDTVRLRKLASRHRSISALESKWCRKAGHCAGRARHGTGRRWTLVSTSGATQDGAGVPQNRTSRWQLTRSHGGLAESCPLRCCFVCGCVLFLSFYKKWLMVS